MNDGTDIAAGLLGASVVGAITLSEPGPFPLFLGLLIFGVTAVFFGYRFYARHAVANDAIDNLTPSDHEGGVRP